MLVGGLTHELIDPDGDVAGAITGAINSGSKHPEKQRRAVATDDRLSPDRPLRTIEKKGLIDLQISARWAEGQSRKAR